MVEDLIKQLYEYQKNAATMLMQAENTKKILMEVYGMKGTNEDFDLQVYQIPFPAYEAQLERHLQEKKEMREEHQKAIDKERENYKKIIKWICIAFATFIIAVFGTVFYIFNNYDFATYEQDVEYGNANYIGNDGDISNGEADYYTGETETPKS